MATPFIRPFRDVDEHFVINLYAYSGATIPAQGIARGTFVKINSGWLSDQNLNDGGPVGGFNPPQPLAVSRRYAVPSTVTLANSGDNILGITLYDVRELDENQVPLIFNPAKKAQLQAVLSGEAVPIATKGVFLYSGLAGTGLAVAGSPAYVSGGQLSAQGSSAATQVGNFLGPVDSKGWVLFRLNV